jgi:predicted ChrR family anti-sigma factor
MPGHALCLCLAAKTRTLRRFSLRTSNKKVEYSRVQPPSVVLRGLNDPDQLTRLAWQPFRDGVEIFPLHSEEDSVSVALLRYQADASVPTHEHVGTEFLFILNGGQRDERGAYQAGDFVVNLPNSRHSVVSDRGCIVLAYWSKPVRFVE